MHCTKCGKYFNVRIKIDGRVRHLNKRKYCFDCSPFGKHNTRKVHLDHEETCICSQCKKSYKKGRGSYKNFCASCRVTNSRKKTKARIVEIMGGKCIICGYNKCISALDFHHKDPNTKEDVIARYSKKFESVLEEANKCILVCCRCHREIHAGLIHWS